MKLRLIYGPPATGKLTVAQELVALTGFKLFHNHATVDLVTPIFERGTPSFGKLVWEIREAVFAEGAKVGLRGMVFTMVYTEDRVKNMERCCKVVEEHGGQACLVRLYCDRAILRHRVAGERRGDHGKITTRAGLDSYLENFEGKNLFGAVSGRDSLAIDTGETEPRNAAQQIAALYGLPLL
jgi:predicted kinase